MQRTLEAWRAAERRLDRAQPGTPEHAAAAAEVERLRDEYRSLLAGPGAMAADPPPLPEPEG
jgi:hypothetical protein